MFKRGDRVVTDIGTGFVEFGGALIAVILDSGLMYFFEPKHVWRIS